MKTVMKNIGQSEGKQDTLLLEQFYNLDCISLFLQFSCSFTWNPF